MMLVIYSLTNYITIISSSCILTDIKPVATIRVFALSFYILLLPQHHPSQYIYTKKKDNNYENCFVFILKLKRNYLSLRNFQNC